MKDVLIFLFAGLLFIQFPIRSEEKWQQLTREDGLSSDVVNQICFDSNDNIWIGTDRGIDRYNGVVQQTNVVGDKLNIDAFSATNGSKKIFARSINKSTYADVDNTNFGDLSTATLWYFDGVSWNRDPISQKIAPNRLNDWPISLNENFIVHNDGNTWIATRQGLVTHDGKDWLLYQSDIVDDIDWVLRTSDGRLWTVSAALGLVSYDGIDWKQELNTRNVLGDGVIVTRATVTHRDTILLGTNIGLYEYNPITNMIYDLKLDSMKVLKILIATDSSLWVSTENRSKQQFLFHFSPDHGWIAHLENQIVTTIFEATDRTIWVGTHQGLYHFDRQDWFKEISNKINCINELKSGILTVGTDSGFWISQDPESAIKLLVNQPGTRFMGLYFASDGSIWGRSSMGILSYDGISWTNHRKEKSTYLGDAFQGGIFEASDGTLWFNGFISYSFKDGIWQTHKIRTFTVGFAETSDGKIWAYGDGGIDWYDGENWIDAKAPELGWRIWSFHENQDGEYWLAGELGTAYFDGVKWTKVSSDYSADFYEDADGFWLLGNGIWRWSNSKKLWETAADLEGEGFNFRGIIKSEDGTLRSMSHGNPGFAKFDDNKWSIHLSSKDRSLSYRNFHQTGFVEYPTGVFWLATNTGLRRIEGDDWYDLTITSGFPSNSIYSVIKDDQGFLWVGTEKGVVRYKPETDLYPPAVRISRIDGAKIPDERVYVTGRSYVTIEWYGGDLQSTKKHLVYQYRISDQWSKAIKQNTVTIGLEDGKHQFQIRAVDHHFNTSTIDEMTIIVKTEKPDLSIMNPATGDIVGGELYIKGRIEDDDFANFQLFFSDAERNKVPTLGNASSLGAPYQLIFSADNEPRTETLAILDTTVFDDGDYHIWLTAQDELQHSSFFKVTIRTDNTLPSVTIYSPKENQQVFKTVNLSAQVSDVHLDSYRLDFSDDSEGKSWEQIYLKANFFQKSEDGSLLETESSIVPINRKWHIPIQSGSIWIRLTATDVAGNTRSEMVQVQVPSAVKTRKGGVVSVDNRQAQLYIPPNTLPRDSIITINTLASTDVEPPLRRLTPIYDLAPATLKLNLIKPATLTCTYNAENLSVNKKPVIFHQNNGVWAAVGGTPNLEQMTISVAILSLGQYTVVEMDQMKATESARLQPDSLTCQPRVFSPKGNGFNTATTISFVLDQVANIDIKVYSVTGQLVNWLSNQITFGSGRQAVDWDGRDDQGEVVATGLYIVTVSVGTQMQNKVVNVWNH